MPDHVKEAGGAMPPIEKATPTSGQVLADRLRELHRLSVSDHENFKALYHDYLQTGIRLLGLKVGIVSRIDKRGYTVLAVAPADAGFTAGDEFKVEDTYCKWVVDEACTVAVEAVGEDPDRRDHPVYLNAKLESYLASPIWVDGQIYGTLNFTHTERRNVGFSSDDKELVELMALSIGQIIERDLLDQQRAIATQRMQENIDLFESAFSHAANGMALVSPDGRWLRVNQALLDIVGYTESELLSMDFQTITHPEDLDLDLASVQAVLAGERDSYRMEKRYFHSSGSIVWVLLSVSMVRHDDGRPRYFVSQIHDITQTRKAMEELIQSRAQAELANRKLQELATRDALTQAYNRRAFDERLTLEYQHSRRNGQPLSLLLIDLDHFKEYNDTYGHPAGDQALIAVARVLVTEVRVNDMVARYGGEEFAVIMPNTDREGCQLLGERIRLAIVGITSEQRKLTGSMGGSTLEPARCEAGQEKAIESLLASADDALYRAKAAGRNRVQFQEASL